MEVKDQIREIESKICYQEMTAAQVFTQMKQLIPSKSELSDLEIVQKALDSLNGQALHISSGGAWIIVRPEDGGISFGGYDYKSILTWAKQTAGHE